MGRALPLTKRQVAVWERFEAAPAAPESFDPTVAGDAGSVVGLVEAAVGAELRSLSASGSALAASALVLARHVDVGESAAAATVAARELRMTLDRIRALDWVPARPSVVDDEEGTVVGPNRLESLRKRGEGGRKAKPRASG